MDNQFWLDRWVEGDIGFHREEVHPELVAHWPKLGLPPRSRVLVPLCGATPDMAWIAAQNNEVIGVELSPIAVERFLMDHRVRHITMDEMGFRTYLGGRYQLWCGDFFALPKEVFSGIDAVYDRASLVAFPDDLRPRYAAFLARQLNPGTHVLLVSLAYNSSEMNGPPFSVPQDEIEKLFSADFEITVLGTNDVITGNAGLAKRGISALNETTYLLKRKPTA